MGEIGRDSSAYRAQKPRHGGPMAGFCYWIAADGPPRRRIPCQTSSTSRARHCGVGGRHPSATWAGCPSCRPRRRRPAPRTSAPGASRSSGIASSFSGSSRRRIVKRPKPLPRSNSTSARRSQQSQHDSSTSHGCTHPCRPNRCDLQ